MPNSEGYVPLPRRNEDLAIRAQARRAERAKLGSIAKRNASERGKLLAWFELLPTSELKEIKVAVERAQGARKVNRLKRAAMKRAITQHNKKQNK
jgi:hypothetical protein